MATRPFYRMEAPVRVPVSPTSGATPFDMSGLIPPNAKSFMFVNLCPFDVRLEGTQVGQTFLPVSAGTGWPIMARSYLGPLTTKMPMSLSVQAFATPGRALPAAGYDYSGCYLELLYGEGD